MPTKKLKYILIASLFFFLGPALTGCGGGGGGNGSSAVLNLPGFYTGAYGPAQNDSAGPNKATVDYGTWEFTVSPDGRVSGLAHSDHRHKDFAIIGSMTSNGILQFTAGKEGESFTFSGSVNSNGDLSGAWSDGSVSGSWSGQKVSTTKKWTYLVYMGADNNLALAGLVDLAEMELVGTNADVNIVVQAEFSTTYANLSGLGYTYNGDTLRFLVQRDGDPGRLNLEAGISIGNVDMGHPDTLRDFIIWAVTNYPADHYALVVWDHGAGWKTNYLGLRGLLKGAVQDATSGSFMSLPDLALAADQAQAETGRKLDLINFDACLMAMYEVAYEFKGRCDYLVFSEE
ncbi:MAG: clostripain-related cysteine peptidase, partial [Pseudomonadota bacterium]